MGTRCSGVGAALLLSEAELFDTAFLVLASGPVLVVDERFCVSGSSLAALVLGSPPVAAGKVVPPVVAVGSTVSVSWPVSWVARVAERVTAPGFLTGMLLLSGFDINDDV